MLKALLLALLRVYQLTLSRLITAAFGPVCRFEPSCSRYAVACISTHGALRGSLLSMKRLCKCHPFHPGGLDPPPGAIAPPSSPSAPPAHRDGASSERDEPGDQAPFARSSSP
jgi:putative membrane protein insertion efficiency factor